jgi:hypothetical protein
MLRIEEGAVPLLRAHNGVDHQCGYERKGERAAGVLHPTHLALGIDAAPAVEQRLPFRANAPFKDGLHVPGQRHGRNYENREKYDCVEPRHEMVIIGWSARSRQRPNGSSVRRLAPYDKRT